MLSGSNLFSPGILITDTDSKRYCDHPCSADKEANRGLERLSYLSQVASKKPDGDVSSDRGHEAGPAAGFTGFVSDTQTRASGSLPTERD